MARFGNCIEWVLRLEDRKLSGVTKDLGDGGGRTRFGITEKNNPEATDLYYNADVATALEFAKDLYWRKYWRPICGSRLPTDELAATLLSFAVNDGIGEAGKLLQRVLGSGLVQDGHIGEMTLAVIAKGDPGQIACNLREVQEQFYEGVFKRDPAKVVYRNGWLRRARAVYPDLPA